MQLPSLFWWLLPSAASCCGVALAGTASLAQTPAPLRSVRDGVYTSAQAERGAAVYDGKCINCHAAKMWGADWTEKSLWDLYETIDMFMPEDNPGTLDKKQVRDVLAYILQANKLPAGMRELPESPDDLKQIRIEPAVP